MKKLLRAYIMPHPPVLISQIGYSETRFCSKTLSAIKEIADEIAELKPHRIIIIGPHGPVFSDAISAYYKNKIKADFRDYTASNIDMEFSSDLDFIDKLSILSQKIDVTVAKLDEPLAEHFDVDLKLDHGLAVPLFFINENYKDFELVSLTHGLLSVSELYSFGKIIKDCIETSDKKTVFIASGDLSHCLSTAGPYSYSEYGKEFDDMLMENLIKNRVFDFLTYSHKKKNLAQTCCVNPITVMFGLFDKTMYKASIKSYEAPFGVGYLLASIDEIPGISPSLVDKIAEWSKGKYDRMRRLEDDYIRLARDAIEYYIRNEKKPFFDANNYNIKKYRAGCFVSIKTESGLRGCIGTINPKKSDLFNEIISNSILAATADDRFEMVEEYELEDLIISVDIIYNIEHINGINELEPSKYGVAVSSGEKLGVLLPGISGVNSPEDQLKTVLIKAGIQAGESYNIKRFTCERHEIGD